MHNLLILESSLPYPVAHGGFLRVFNLMRELSRTHECHLVVLAEIEPVPEPLKRVFRTCRFFPAPPIAKSWRRFFASTSDRFWAPSAPEFFRHTVQSLQRLIDALHIDTVVATSIYVAEFLRPLRNVGKVVDACDCLTLAHERANQYGVPARGMDPRGIADRLDFSRVRRIEAGLTRHADLVTTVSPRIRHGYGPSTVTARKPFRCCPTGCRWSFSEPAVTPRCKSGPSCSGGVGLSSQ